MKDNFSFRLALMCVMTMVVIVLYVTIMRYGYETCLTAAKDDYQKICNCQVKYQGISNINCDFD